MVKLCPECGSQQVITKKHGMGGKRRVSDAAYTCDSCRAHFDDPDEGDAKAASNPKNTGPSKTARMLLDADKDTPLRGGDC